MSVFVLAFLVDSISVFPENVFSSASPLRFLNRLHVTTRPWVVRALLPFGVGDSVNEDDLYLVEKHLRSFGIFSEVELWRDRNEVEVYTRDAWTTSLYIDAAREGGLSRFGLGVSEHNFLGLARGLSLKYQYHYERSWWELGWEDRTLGNSTLHILWQERSDGQMLEFGWQKPLVLREDRACWSFKIRRESLSIYRYWDGEAVDTERVSISDARAHLGFNFLPGDAVALGLEARAFERKGWDHREFWGVGPFVLAERKKFVEAKYFKGFGYTEDLFLGPRLQVALLGAPDRVGGFWSLEAGFGGRGPLFASLGFDGQAVASHGIAWGKGGLRAEIYSRLHPGAVLGARARFERLFNPPGLEGYTLGGTTGLRGFPAFYAWGRWRLVSQAELRLWGPGVWDMAVPGVALFWDWGGVEEEWAWDVGVGLRLGLLSVYKFPVLRLDLAWPRGRGSPQLSAVTEVF